LRDRARAGIAAAMPENRPSTRPPTPSERLLAEFRPDPRAYRRTQAVLALLACVAGVAVTQLLQIAVLWEVLIPLALALGVAARGLLGQAAAMAGRWRLTDRRLAGPGGVALVLVEVTDVSTSLGSVVVMTAAGERHTIRHLADAAGAAETIGKARDEAKLRPRGTTLPPPVPVAGEAP
jgi:hypothetical protein